MSVFVFLQFLVVNKSHHSRVGTSYPIRGKFANERRVDIFVNEVKIPVFGFFLWGVPNK